MSAWLHTQQLVQLYLALASYNHCDKLPHTQWPETTKLYYLYSPGSQKYAIIFTELKLKTYQQGLSLPAAPRGELVSLSFQPLVVPVFLGCGPFLSCKAHQSSRCSHCRSLFLHG